MTTAGSLFAVIQEDHTGLTGSTAMLGVDRNWATAIRDDLQELADRNSVPVVWRVFALTELTPQEHPHGH